MAETTIATIPERPKLSEEITLTEKAAVEIRRKGRPVGTFRIMDFHEGLSAQIMHVGPYSAEAPTIERIRSFMNENGYAPNGKHHEIYLGDPHRTKPEKLKTILRQPIITNN
jgi:hypothetical protein